MTSIKEKKTMSFAFLFHVIIIFIVVNEVFCKGGATKGAAGGAQGTVLLL